MIWPPALTEAVAALFPPFLGSKDKHLYHRGTTISITINRKQVRNPFAYFLALDLPIFPSFGHLSFNLPKLREWLRWRMTLAMLIAFSVDLKISFICHNGKNRPIKGGKYRPKDMTPACDLAGPCRVWICFLLSSVSLLD